MTPYTVILVIPPAQPGTMSNREGAVGLGAIELGQSAFRYPPHTVATVAAVLRAHGFQVLVVDAVAQGLDVASCVQQLVAARPDLVGVLVSWATQVADEALLIALKRQMGSAPIVAMGNSTAHMAPLPGADFWLLGEAESTFSVLVQRLAQSNPPAKGIVSAAALGVDNLVQDLDALPIPAWDLLPWADYPFLSLMSSRGCDRGCGWCPYIVAQGGAYRACSPSRVVSELAQVVGRYHPKRIVFRDPAFALDRQRVAVICRQVLAEPRLAPGRNLLWECESHPCHFDEHLLLQMSLAGCVGIKIGLEAVSPQLLGAGRLLGAETPQTYLDQIAALVRTCARLGMACRLYVMLGLPGQTLEDVRETAQFVQAIRPTSMSFKMLKHYPRLALAKDDEPDAEQLAAMRAVFQATQEVLVRAPRATPSVVWRMRRKATLFIHKVIHKGV